ncbi:IS4 family transposase, partial [Clostridium senegalense]|nr:IS4 family transposase [Clostridium senegalense]
MKFINSISKISKNISVFSEKRLNKIAKEVGFIQRRSKIDGNMFFKLFTFGAFSVDNLSLRS